MWKIVAKMSRVFRHYGSLLTGTRVLIRRKKRLEFCETCLRHVPILPSQVELEQMPSGNGDRFATVRATVRTPHMQNGGLGSQSFRHFQTLRGNLDVLTSFFALWRAKVL